MNISITRPIWFAKWVAEKMAGLQVPEEMLADLPDQSSKITILLRESCNPELASREMMAMFVEFRRLAKREASPSPGDDEGHV